MQTYTNQITYITHIPTFHTHIHIHKHTHTHTRDARTVRCAPHLQGPKCRARRPCSTGGVSRIPAHQRGAHEHLIDAHLGFSHLRHQSVLVSRGFFTHWTHGDVSSEVLVSAVIPMRPIEHLQIRVVWVWQHLHVARDHVLVPTDVLMDTS
jgi:hypothetical protein